MMAQAAGDLGAVVSRRPRFEAVGKSRDVGRQVSWRARPMSPVQTYARSTSREAG